MNNYTKVSDNLVAKYGIKVAYVYAKLSYRMKLSKRNKKFFDNDYFVIYKIKDLAHDCHLGRSSIINIMNKLESIHLIYRVHTMFANKIYLPESNNANSKFKNQPAESTKSKLSKQSISNNKNYNNYVYSSSVNVKKAKFPSMKQIRKQFNQKLVDYAITDVYRNNIECGIKVHSKLHFIYGVLRRWQRKGLRTLNEVMLSEHDSRAHLKTNGPKIPIFKI